MSLSRLIPAGSVRNTPQAAGRKGPRLPHPGERVIVSRISVDAVVEAAKKALYTGHIGDGKIFVYNVTRVVKIRTGEEDYAALQDVE